MSTFEKSYQDAIHKVSRARNWVTGRNGKVRMLPNITIEADLSEGFPLITARKGYPNTFIHEVAWLLSGQTNTKYLRENGVGIWDLWADENGDLGPVYGKQLRDFAGVDQLHSISAALADRRQLTSRRLMWSLWNPVDLPDMALPPCHYACQFVWDGKRLNAIVTMRSLDLACGLPYDMAMYSTILLLAANTANVEAGKVYINAGNAHIYEQHVRGAGIYAGRPWLKLPQINLNKMTLTTYDPEKVELIGYQHRDPINFKVVK